MTQTPTPITPQDIDEGVKKSLNDVFNDASNQVLNMIWDKLPGALPVGTQQTKWFTQLEKPEDFKNGLIVLLGYDKDGAPRDTSQLVEIAIGEQTIFQQYFQVLSFKLDYKDIDKNPEYIADHSEAALRILGPDRVYEYDDDRKLLKGARLEYTYDETKREPSITLDVSRANAREIQKLTKLITLLKKGTGSYVFNREKYSEVYQKAVVREYRKGGVTQESIASSHGITARTLRRWLDKYAEK